MPCSIENDIVALRGRVNGVADATSAIPWTDILDGASPLRLLYSLRVAMEALDKSASEYVSSAARGDSANRVRTDAGLPSPSTNAVLAGSSSWGSAFLSSGGFARVESLFFSISLEPLLGPAAPAPTHRRAAAALLVTLFARFVVVRIRQSRNAPRSHTSNPVSPRTINSQGPSFSLTLDADRSPRSRPRLVERTLEWLAFACTCELPREGVASDSAAPVDSTSAPPEAGLVTALGDILAAALFGLDAVADSATAWAGTSAIESTTVSRLAPAPSALAALFSAPRAGETLVAALVSPNDARVRKSAADVRCGRACRLCRAPSHFLAFPSAPSGDRELVPPRASAGLAAVGARALRLAPRCSLPLPAPSLRLPARGQDGPSKRCPGARRRAALVCEAARALERAPDRARRCRVNSRAPRRRGRRGHGRPEGRASLART